MTTSGQPMPGAVEYSLAIQTPSICFEGTNLESATVATSGMGMPLTWNGAFATVFSVNAGNVDYAVRCFTREVTDQKDRYENLSLYLKDILLDCMVDFEYNERGIKVQGDWYPVVQMTWVNGKSLDKHLGDRNGLNATANDLTRLAARWLDVDTNVHALNISHNDLEHGNIMVRNDGEIRLVDYDGIFFPDYRGTPAPELGHDNYRHPRRTINYYDIYVDHFPSLVIYLSLRGLAVNPSLWDFYNENNLIFTKDDFVDPGTSPVISLLKQSSDLEVIKLTEFLEEYCSLPVNEIPDLNTMVGNLGSSSAPRAISSASLPHQVHPQPAPQNPAQVPSNPA